MRWIWMATCSGAFRSAVFLAPIASPNGDALVHDFGVLYDYNPDGSRDWAFNFPFPSGTLIGPSVAPDGTIYIFHSYTNLWSLTATGHEALGSLMASRGVTSPWPRLSRPTVT